MELDYKAYKDNITVAKREQKASLVLKNAKYVNVFTEELMYGDIAINNGYIVGVGDYSGLTEIDLKGCIVSPGFIDGHIHIESSMVDPTEFSKAAVVHGTTSVITDPHEIANVCGINGIEYMMQSTENLPIAVYFMMPSCVPSTKFDETGAEIDDNTILAYYDNHRVLGLAEMMNYVGVINGEDNPNRKIYNAKKYNKVVDGHAPNLSDNELNAYICTGIKSDHECSTIEEAIEKIRKGQWVMIREGTAAKNLEALIKLFDSPYSNKAMLVTDDRHPEDLIKYGHIDYIIKKAIGNGANPIKAIIMATINPATFFGLTDVGAIAPGYKADLVVIDDFLNFNIKSVYFNGEKVVDNSKIINAYKNIVNEEIRKLVYNSFNIHETKVEDFKFNYIGKKARVIGLNSGELLTEEIISNNINSELVKLAVLERHKNTGHIGLALLKGYGLKEGAIATSVGHDSHNLIVVGSNDNDMSIAANKVIKNKGGWAIVKEGEILGELPLPIAGLMSELSVSEISEEISKIKKIASELGVSNDVDPFMTLGFLSLPVIPKLKLTSLGLIDVDRQEIVDVFVD